MRVYAEEIGKNKGLSLRELNPLKMVGATGFEPATTRPPV